MKKQIVASVGLLLAVFLSSGAYATEALKSCSIVFAEKVNTEAARKFLKDTHSMRDELMVKELMLLQEFVKKPTDENRIEALRWDIADLQHELEISARKNGIPIDGMWCMTNCGLPGAGKKDERM